MKLLYLCLYIFALVGSFYL